MQVKVYFTQLFGAIATLRLVKHLLKRVPLLKLNSDNGGAASLDPDSIWGGDDGGLSATGKIFYMALPSIILSKIISTPSN